MPFAHIITYYEVMCDLYATAAEIGISTAHVAEFYLERWWDVAGDTQQREVA